MGEIKRKLQDIEMTRPPYVAIFFLVGVAFLVVSAEEEKKTAELTRAGEDNGQTYKEGSNELYQNTLVSKENG